MNEGISDKDFELASFYFDHLLDEMARKGNPYRIGTFDLHKRFSVNTEVAFVAKNQLKTYPAEALTFLQKNRLLPHANERVLSGEAYQGVNELRIKYLSYMDLLEKARSKAESEYKGPNKDFFDPIKAVDQEALQHPSILTQEADDALRIVQTWRDIIPLRGEAKDLRRTLTFIAMEDQFM